MSPRSKGSSARDLIRAFFMKNLGRVVTSDEIREVAGISEWARRLRELRDEEGMQILSHNDRETLKANEYLLETLEKKSVIARGISDKLRRRILDRDGQTCQVCGAGAGEDSGCELGKKCKLQVDHIVPITHGGTDDENNLRAVCSYFNKDKSNLKTPTSRDAIHALTLIRRLPRNVQMEIYEFLAKKFDLEK